MFGEVCERFFAVFLAEYGDRSAGKKTVSGYVLL